LLQGSDSTEESFKQRGFFLLFGTDKVRTFGVISDGMDFSGFQDEWNFLLHFVSWEVELAADPWASPNSIPVGKNRGRRLEKTHQH